MSDPVEHCVSCKHFGKDGEFEWCMSEDVQRDRMVSAMTEKCGEWVPTETWSKEE